MPTLTPTAVASPTQAPTLAVTVFPTLTQVPLVVPTQPRPLPTATPGASAPPPASIGAQVAQAPAKLLLYVLNDALWVASFDGIPPRQVSLDGQYPLPTEPPDYPPAQMSPDGRWILGVPSKADQGTWLYSTDGGVRRQLSPNRLALSWAPNSQGYAWADETSLYTSTLAEGAPVFTATKVESPAAILPLAIIWAPSGDQIAFQVREGGVATLRVVSAAGGPVRTLARAQATATEYSQAAVTWAPDGQKILWTLPVPAWMVYLTNQPAAQLPADLSRPFGFSPDSQRLLALWRENNQPRLGSMDLAGVSRQVLATSKGDFAYAAWAPEGGRVAYVSFPESGPGDPDANELWVVNTDGTGGRRLGAGSDLAPFSAEWLAANALLVASGEKPPEITLRRLDVGNESIQTLVRGVGWFFAVAARR